jgi:hypothetical protein
MTMCGSERWLVKTFADSDRWRVDLTWKYRTIAQLNAFKKPADLPQDDRKRVELSAYRVTGMVTYVANEDDGDVHLAVQSVSGAAARRLRRDRL